MAVCSLPLATRVGSPPASRSTCRDATLRRAAAFIAVLTSASVLALASPSGAATGPLRYVAMGDSYSAASGDIPPDPTAAPECLRSTVNYPHLIASKVGAALTDVTCGGADT